MLAIISDLHLTDGTSGASIPPGAFQIFAERLQDLAYRASWRTAGNYAPIERIDLILLGDVLDVIRSNTWLLAGTTRPWSDPTSTQFFDLTAEITQAVLRNNEPGMAVLRQLARGEEVRLAPALRSGQPAKSAQPVSIPVRIHYMVGNHDWFYHLPGPRFDALRHTIVSAMGLANAPNVPFPHDPAEDGELLDLMRRHRVLARHGDIYDPFNFEQDRDGSSLGDAIVVELVNRFTSEVEHELGEDLPAAVLLGLREIDNIRPLLMIPVWIDGILERSCPWPAMRKKVKQVWDRMADDFLALQFVRDRDTWSPCDLVDGLERALKFTRRLSLGWASAISTWLHQFRGSCEESYRRFALSEQDFRNRRAKHIVYGHTHDAESVPLDASYAEGYVHNQVYLNAGTWRRVHRQTTFAPDEHEFIASDTMTFLFFFQGDERGGRPYESWSGTLGLNMLETENRRVDPPHPSLARPRHASQPGASFVVSTSTVSPGGPHFSVATDRAAALSGRGNG